MSARRKALEAQLREHPDDVATHLVYADLLQAHDDPHGELVVLQHALATQPTRELKRKEAGWFKRHFAARKYATATWRLGFVRELALRTERTLKPDMLAWLRTPACQFLDALTLRGEMSHDAITNIVKAVPHVRELVVASDDILNARVIEKMVASLPALRRLEIVAPALQGPFTIEAPELTSLALGHRVQLELDVDMIAPKLHSLILDAATLSGTTIANVLRLRWPLTRLGLFDERAPKLLPLLRTSRLRPQLEAVGVEWDDAIDGPILFAAAIKPLGERTILPSPFWRGDRLHDVGLALRGVRRLAEALRCFELGILALPEDPEMWVDHGNVLAELGRPDEANASYRRALLIDPGHAPALVALKR